MNSSLTSRPPSDTLQEPPLVSNSQQSAGHSLWKPFRNSTKTHAPQASILFDKFHVLRHLGEALDEVRKSE